VLVDTSKLGSRPQPISAMVAAPSTTGIRHSRSRLPRKSIHSRSQGFRVNLRPTASRGRFIEYVLERPDVQKPWKEHTEHEFVAGLADGTLPAERFKYYLIQDYLFLV